MKIIVDAMGGDNAPKEIIKGSMLAAEEYGADIVFVGDKKVISQCAEENSVDLKNSEIVNASSVITMHDDAKSVLKEKSDSSRAVGFEHLN